MLFRKIKNFTDLEAWQKSHFVVLEIYNITKTFPQHELFSLTNQMRRAAISVTSNIAEGFSRYSKNDKIYFYTIATGSLTELQNQIIVSKDLKYISTQQYAVLYEATTAAHKLINALISSIRKSNV